MQPLAKPGSPPICLLPTPNLDVLLKVTETNREFKEAVVELACEVRGRKKRRTGQLW